MAETVLTARLREAARARELPPPHLRQQIREQAGASRRDIADALRVSAAAVADYERGRRRPRTSVAARYADLLDALRRL